MKIARHKATGLVEGGVYYHCVNDYIFIVKTHWWDCYKSPIKKIEVLKVQREISSGCFVSDDAETVIRHAQFIQFLGKIQ